MAFLDFIKNRGQEVSAPANEQSSPSPETAKQMYTREAEQAKQGPQLQDKMPPDQLAKAKEAQNIKIADGKDVSAGNVSPLPTPSDATSSPQPMRQVSMQQDNSAPALSPTTAQMGSTVYEQESPKPTPANTPKPTPARNPPSWER